MEEKTEHLTVEDIIVLLNTAISNGLPKTALVYASVDPCDIHDSCIENAKPIISACTCETNKHLVLLIKN